MKESNTVNINLDPQCFPPLTAQQRAELEAVAAMPDEDIDYSDAPYLPDAVWILAETELPYAEANKGQAN